MTRYSHPVAGLDLLATPEMRLYHPAELPATMSEGVYDEGEGHGYDGLSPNACATRRVVINAGAGGILDWFVAHFLVLGWVAEPTRSSRGMPSVNLQRDPDERLDIHLRGPGDLSHCPATWTRGPNLLRVSLTVRGTFPEGHVVQGYGPRPFPSSP